MAGVGRRFDLEEARREALAERRAKRVRAIVSNVVFFGLLLAVAIGGKVGWDKWQERRAADRAAAEAAREDEERRAAERRREAAEAAKAAEERRAAERKAREEKAEAERRAREEKAEAERKAKEEARRRKEEERRLAEETRAEQQELRKEEDRVVSSLSFRLDDRLCLEYGLDDIVETSVDERRWLELAQLSQRRQTIDFLSLLRGSNVTNAFSDARYPDRETFARLLENLDAERFTLVLRLKDEARTRRLALVAGSVEGGLAAPEGARPLKSGTRVVGWTVPFAYGDKAPLFLLDQASADRFSREWAALRRRLRTEAAKVDNRDAFVSARLEKELPGFLRSVRVEVTTPPPEPKAGRRDDAQRRAQKPRATMKGSGSDIRTLRGPQSRR